MLSPSLRGVNQQRYRQCYHQPYGGVNQQCYRQCYHHPYGGVNQQRYKQCYHQYSYFEVFFRANKAHIIFTTNHIETI